MRKILVQVKSTHTHTHNQTNKNPPTHTGPNDQKTHKLLTNHTHDDVPKTTYKTNHRCRCIMYVYPQCTAGGGVHPPHNHHTSRCTKNHMKNHIKKPTTDVDA